MKSLLYSERRKRDETEREGGEGMKKTKMTWMEMDRVIGRVMGERKD